MYPSQEFEEIFLESGLISYSDETFQY